MGDPYRRRLQHPAGDAANIFLFDSALLREALEPYAPDAAPERPLTCRFGRVHAATYLRQRMLLARVAREPASDPGAVVEQALTVLDEVLAATYQTPPGRSAPGEQRERVEQLKRRLFERYAEPVTLGELAASVELSVTHLCRTFRRHTGQTIYRYLQRLRLRNSLVLLERADLPLADLALEVGFAHQSHFTELFRREYGRTPGEVRRALGRR